MTPAEQLLDHLERKGKTGTWKQLTEQFKPGAHKDWACEIANNAGLKLGKTIADNHEGLAKECEEVGLPLDNVNYYWYKGKHYSINVKAGKDEDDTLVKAIIDVLDSYHTTVTKSIKQTPITGDLKAIKATISDLHVGLEPNPGGRALFSYKYNSEIFNDNLDKVFNSIIKEFNTHGKFDLLVLDDLGDGLDGWNAETTRGGHKLQQNMDNIEAFKVYVSGKLRLIENIIAAGVANKIKIRNVGNCNHSGDFGFIANTAIEMILSRNYDKDSVDFYILGRFMEHFEYGDHTYILTHGKDKEFQFKGLPLDLNDKAISFITNYIDHYDIRTKFIHVEKGDLHQVAYKRTKKFDYRNFMSFAPPSSWIQHNFGDSYAGYSIQVIPKHSNEVSHTDYFFDLKIL